MADNFVRGETMDGETGLKTGAQLEDLVTEATFAVGSGALDQTTLDDNGSGKARIKAAGVDTAQLAASAVETAKINNDAVDKDKIAADVAGDGLGQNADGSLEVNVDDSSIETNADALRVKALGITNAMCEAGMLDVAAPSDQTDDFDPHQRTALTLMVGYVVTTDADYHITFKSDAANPPTTTRFELKPAVSGARIPIYGVIKKDDYYEFGLVGGSGTLVAFFYTLSP